MTARRTDPQTDVVRLSAASSDSPLKTTTSAESLQRFHDEHSPLGRVRRICKPVDEDEEPGGVLHDWDPFA